MKKLIRYVCVCLGIVCTVILSSVCYWQQKLPNDYKVQKGNALSVSEAIIAAPVFDTENSRAQTVGNRVGEQYRSVLKLWGLFPVKNVSVEVVENSVVVLGGTPFGIKLYTDGVLVVSLSDVDTKTGKYSPAQKAGIKTGDMIVSINGTAVYTNKEVAKLVESSAGRPMTFCIRRNGITSTVTFQAARSVSENCYKAGLWVRDSSAGIGTVTFYDPKTNVLAGLGHPICDVDTGEIMPISTGEIVPARIYSVTKSAPGSPGELHGGFENGSLGTLLDNTPAGVYAAMNGGMAGKTVEVAMKQEIKEGPAKIYTTVSGVKPDWYTINIKQVNYRDTSIVRNMIVEITDQRLLKQTGGIVQGMSGSPIIQNGKLIGAVTHVLVNDPAKGYAIFAENMLGTAQAVAKEQLQEAS